MKKLNYLLMFLVMTSVSSIAQKNYNTIKGIWQGTITTTAGSLAMIMKIKPTETSISVNLDVTAQMAKDVPSTGGKFKNDSLVIEYSMMRAKYRGTMTSDSNLIVGVWEQAGVVFPLQLNRTQKVPEPVRHSQEPLKPYSYNEEEIVFVNAKAKVTLAGTFTSPKNKQNCTTVILISGSGPQSRNEELLGHKPFLILADHLTKNGIAVLRFDDRGVGQSSGDFSSATSYDFSTDVEAAFAYLQTRKEVNKKSIGLIGHSEGGLIAPMLASRKKEIGFVVLLAGPGIKGSELLALQGAALSNAAGVSAEKIEKNKLLNHKIYELAIKKSLGASDSILKLLKAEGLTESAAKAQLKSLQTPWFNYFLAADPSVYLSKLSCRVMAINGKKDLQVPFQENLDAIEVNLQKAGNKNYNVKAYADLNHLFQHCTTGLPGEYGSIDETMSLEVLNDVSDWILKEGQN